MPNLMDSGHRLVERTSSNTSYGPRQGRPASPPSRRSDDAPVPRPLMLVFCASAFSVGIGLYSVSLLWPVLDLPMSGAAILVDILGIALVLVALSFVWRKPKPAKRNA